MYYFKADRHQLPVHCPLQKIKVCQKGTILLSKPISSWMQIIKKKKNKDQAFCCCYCLKKKNKKIHWPKCEGHIQYYVEYFMRTSGRIRNPSAPLPSFAALTQCLWAAQHHPSHSAHTAAELLIRSSAITHPPTPMQLVSYHISFLFSNSYASHTPFLIQQRGLSCLSLRLLTSIQRCQ